MDFYTERKRQEIVQLLKNKQSNDVFRYEVDDAENVVFLKISNIISRTLWKSDRKVTYVIECYDNEEDIVQLSIQVVDYESWWAMVEYGSVMGEFLNKKIGLV